MTAFADGTSVVVGQFDGRVTFGAGESRATTLVAVGSDEAYVAKYAADGSLVWAKSAGGVGQDTATGVGALADGGTIVTGRFDGTATFGKGEPRETRLVTPSEAGFLAKYDADGNIIWVKRAFTDSGYPGPAPGFAVLPDGSALFATLFVGTMTFDPEDPDATVLTAGGRDSFVAKWAPSGSLAWVRQVKCVHDYVCEVWASGLAAASDGSAYVTGWYSGTPTFGPGEPDEATLPNPARYFDMFLAKLRPDGTLEWVVRSAGTGSVDASGVAVLADGGVAVTGGFDSATIFGMGETNETKLDASDAAAFLVKYAPDGRLLWARSAASSATSAGADVAALGDDMVVAGAFQGSMTPASSGGARLVSAGGWDAFVERVSSNGSVVWVTRAGGPPDEWPVAVVSSTSGGVLVTGTYLASATFGAKEPRQTTLLGTGSAATFVARFTP